MRAGSLVLLVGAAACLPACASKRPDAGSARMVNTKDLPAAQKEAWDLYHRGGAAWEVEREKVRADPELLRFVVDNLVVLMVRSYDRSALARAGQLPGPFERAQAELAILRQGSIPLLVGMLGVQDGIVAFLAADTLKRIGADAVPGVAGRLDAPEPEVRRRAAELLADLPHAGDGEPAVLEKLGARAEKDEAWIVRGQAALSLGVRGARHEHKGYAQAVLARALHDPDPAVSKSACQALANLGEIRAVPALIRFLEEAVRGAKPGEVRAAQESLRRLTREPRDLDPEAWWRVWEGRGEVRRDADPH